MKLSNKITNFNYSSIKSRDSVVVLGAGPSLTSNIKNIKKYIVKNNSVVISANYNFISLGIKTDYTYITDKEKLIKNIHTIRSPIVVPVSIFFDKRCANVIRDFHNRLKFAVYKVGEKNTLSVYDCSGGLLLDSHGEFHHCGLGIAGLGALAISLVFQPKKILIVGIDDPKPGKDYKTMYDGKKVFYGKDRKCKKVIRYFTCNILPTLRKKNITVDTYEDVGFFGLDKKTLDFNILG